MGLSGYELNVSNPLDPGSILNPGELKQVVVSCSSKTKVAIGGGANVVVDPAHSDAEAEIVWTGITPQLDSNGVPRAWAAEARNTSAFPMTLNAYCICVYEDTVGGEPGAEGIGFDARGSVGGVRGASDDQYGVEGVGGKVGVDGVGEIGVRGRGNQIKGRTNGIGVWGVSEHGNGIVAETNSFKESAATLFQRNPNSFGAALHAEHLGKGAAAEFIGSVHITDILKVDMDVQLGGGDLAEQFEVVGELAAEPGCVVVLAGNDRVRVSDAPYDHRVAGVVSGAGSYRPALVLDSRAGADRRPLALSGKVWCNVDADYGPVEIGDLLTTSPTPGYAMRAADPVRAFGAVIGKALGNLQSGRGMVPVLVALQ